MTNSLNWKIHNDLPATNPLMDFDKITDVLLSLLEDKNLETPINIGIFGSWGKGKSTLMKNIEKKLSNKAEILLNDKKLPDIITVWYNAWEFQDEEYIWGSLGLHIINEITKIINLDNLFDSNTKENLKKAIGITEKTLLKKMLNIGKAISKQVVPELYKIVNTLENQSKDDSKTNLATLFSSYVSDVSELKKSFKKLIEMCNFKIIIFIDDIDRISDPEKAVSILEGLHLFLSVKNTIFVLAISQKVLRHGLRRRYATQNILPKKEENEKFDIEEELAKTYLEKIIQIPFNMPELQEKQIEEIIKKSFGLVKGLEEYTNDFNPNPRWIKRLANHYLLIKNLNEKFNPELTKKDDFDLKLIKTLIFQKKWEKLYEMIQKEGISHVKNINRNSEDENKLLSNVSNYKGKDAFDFLEREPRIEDDDLQNYLDITSVSTIRYEEEEEISETKPMTYHEETYYNFWKDLFHEFDETYPTKRKNRPPSKYAWITAKHINSIPIQWAFSGSGKNKIFRLEVSIEFYKKEKNVKYFEELINYKDEIYEKMNDIKWDKQDNNKKSLIYFIYPNNFSIKQVTENEFRKELIEWGIKNMITFLEIFEQYIPKIHKKLKVEA